MAPAAEVPTWLLGLPEGIARQAQWCGEAYCTPELWAAISAGKTAPSDLAAAHTAHIALCTTVFRRCEQFKKVAALNLALIWRYQRLVTWHVTVFLDAAGEGARLLDWVKETLEPALAIRLLRVTMSDKLQWWHASTAKNTVHRHALEQHPLDGLFLVNLDGDGILGPSFVKSAMDRVTSGSQPIKSPVFVGWKGHEPGMTGRMLYSAWVFQRLQGYDQSLGPSGYQDIDLRDRFAKVQA